ncbi:MAG: alpha/beta hydrolase [Patescibacteria group bacterium]
MEIKNRDGEKLDVSIEGANLDSAKQIIVFAHGFGTDKHERGTFDQISEKIINSSNDVATIRFSYSGFGESEGDQKVKTLDTMVSDLSSVMDFVKNSKAENSAVKMIAFSLGNHITAKYLASVDDTRPEKVILINLPECKFKSRMQSYFKDKPGTKIDDLGVWHLERSSGSTTYVGSGFWDSVSHPESQLSNLENLTRKYGTYLIRATDDEIIDSKASDAEISDFPFEEILYLRGDHNYSKLEYREEFMKSLMKVLDI